MSNRSIILWLVAVMFIIVVVVVLIRKMRKPKTAGSGGGVINPNVDLNVNIGDPDYSNIIDPDFNPFALREQPLTAENLRTGKNMLDNHEYPPYMMYYNEFGVPPNHYNSLSRPLMKSTDNVYMMPFNQWGGVIKTF